MRKPTPAQREREDSVADVLGTLISWMAASSVSPIRFDEAEHLLKRLSAIPAAERARRAQETQGGSRG